MQRLTENKIVLVTRKTRLAELVARFNTVQQAKFYVEHLGADFSDYLREDENYHQAMVQSQRTLESIGRLQVIERGFLPNFMFGKSDTVVVLGQDGLVANTVKYLDGQHVLGVNPDPRRWDGQLLPFGVHDLERIVLEMFRDQRPLKAVTLAKAQLNNGQCMVAVNDLFIGPKSHTSIRYRIQLGNLEEQHSSSGVIVSTGVGSTGWLKSLIAGATAIADHIQTDGRTSSPPGRAKEPPAIAPIPWDADYLRFTVREPFPSRATQANLVFGKITAAQNLRLTSLMSDNGVIFSDGIEADFLEFNSGVQATIGLAEKRGILVV